MRATPTRNTAIDTGLDANTASAVAGAAVVFTPEFVDHTGVPYPSDPATWTITNDDSSVEFDVNPTTGVVTLSSTKAGPHQVTLMVPTPFGDQTVVISFVVAPGTPANLDLVPSLTSVNQGGTVTPQVTGIDEFGNEFDVTDHVVFTSDVPTDVVSGATVSFPTASPHTITATHDSGCPHR